MKIRMLIELTEEQRRWIAHSSGSRKPAPREECIATIEGLIGDLLDDLCYDYERDMQDEEPGNE